MDTVSRYRQLAGLEPALSAVSAQDTETDNEHLCVSKKQVVFAKTHKTGSSTLQNIFFRFFDQFSAILAIF